MDPAAALREATERNAREARAEREAAKRERAAADVAAQAEAEADTARVRERGQAPQQLMASRPSLITPSGRLRCSVAANFP